MYAWLAARSGVQLPILLYSNFLFVPLTRASSISILIKWIIVINEGNTIHDHVGWCTIYCCVIIIWQKCGGWVGGTLVLFFFFLPWGTLVFYKYIFTYTRMQTSSKSMWNESVYVYLFMHVRHMTWPVAKMVLKIHIYIFIIVVIAIIIIIIIIFWLIVKQCNASTSMA